jgi:hypothetical protein
MREKEGSSVASHYGTTGWRRTIIPSACTVLPRGTCNSIARKSLSSSPLHVTVRPARGRRRQIREERERERGGGGGGGGKARYKKAKARERVRSRVGFMHGL